VGFPREPRRWFLLWLRSTSPHHSHNTLRSPTRDITTQKHAGKPPVATRSIAPLSTARRITAPDSAHPHTQPCSTPPSSLRLSPHAPSLLPGSPRPLQAPRCRSLEAQLRWNGKTTARHRSCRNWRHLRCSWLSAATLRPIRYVTELEAEGYTGRQHWDMAGEDGGQLCTEKAGRLC
jgi:hypothetical protein